MAEFVEEEIETAEEKKYRERSELMMDDDGWFRVQRFNLATGEFIIWSGQDDFAFISRGTVLFKRFQGVEEEVSEGKLIYKQGIDGGLRLAMVHKSSTKGNTLNICRKQSWHSFSGLWCYR